MSGALSTHSRLQRLLRQNLSGIEFVNLCQQYGMTGITNQWLSRAMRKNDFAHDTQVLLDPLVIRIEDLIARFHPAPLSFADAEHIKLLLDLIHGSGLNLRAEIE